MLNLCCDIYPLNGTFIASSTSNWQNIFFFSLFPPLLLFSFLQVTSLCGHLRKHRLQNLFSLPTSLPPFPPTALPLAPSTPLRSPSTVPPSLPLLRPPRVRPSADLRKWRPLRRAPSPATQCRPAPRPRHGTWLQPPPPQVSCSQAWPWTPVPVRNPPRGEAGDRWSNR